MAEIQHLLKFNSDERRIISNAMVHIRIGYSDWPEPEDEGQKAIFKSLRLIERQPVTVEDVQRAMQGLTTLAEACEVQADLPFWRNALLEPREERPGQEPAVAGSGGVPIIANGEDFCQMMAQTREWQLSEIRDAQEVLQVALDYMGATV